MIGTGWKSYYQTKEKLQLPVENSSSIGSLSGNRDPILKCSDPHQLRSVSILRFDVFFEAFCESFLLMLVLV